MHFPEIHVFAGRCGLHVLVVHVDLDIPNRSLVYRLVNYGWRCFSTPIKEDRLVHLN